MTDQERRDAELDEEIRAHLAMAAQDHIARGASADAAAAAARREFGNVGLVKETTRSMWGGGWLDRLRQDLRYALRSLKRAPAFAVVAILTLALGIGANTAMFTVVNGVLLRPLPFPSSDRLYAIAYQHQGSFASGFSLDEPALLERNYVEFAGRQRSWQSVAAYAELQVTLTGAGDPVRIEAAEVTTAFTRVLGVAPALGAAFAPDDGEAGRDAVVLISDQLWQSRLGGDPQIVGRHVMLDGSPRTVIGVLPPGFEFPHHTRLWIPDAVHPNGPSSASSGLASVTWMRPVVARLRDGVSEGAARAELAGIAPNFSIDPGETRAAMVAQVLPLRDVLVGDVSGLLWILSGAVACVLLIACANVANLLLMRSATRQDEMALRTALGATRSRLVRQLLTESVLIAATGGLLGAAVAVAGVRALITLAPADLLPRVETLRVDGAVLAFTALLSLGTGIAFGLAPALRLTRSDLHRAIGPGDRTTRRHGGLRAAFVTGEIAIALVLLAGAGLLVRSFAKLRAVELGFRPEQVVAMTVNLPRTTYRDAAAMQRFHAAVLEGLAQVPGIEAAGAVNWLPLGNALVRGSYAIEGLTTPPGVGTWVDKPVVNAGYFRAMGIRLREGRAFTEQDVAGAPRVAILSAGLARRLWPGASALGRRVAMLVHPRPEDWLTVVGVVNDIIQEDLTGQHDPALYRPYAQVPEPEFLGHMTFEVRTAADPRLVAGAMRDVVRRVDPDQPVENLSTMTGLVDRTTAEPLFQARLLTAFSLLALALAAIGIYGVLAYSVAERTHEIGIRMALGAGTRDIGRMVVRRALGLSIPGLALGVLGALALTRVLSGLLFSVKPGDPATLAVVTLLLGGVALLAAWIPARRASRVDPQVALRAE
ncbi:MAG TPA: ABC transporter permease [Gemmatimonadales bacterium]|jgi:putative ABC transport system permease protein